MNWWEGVVLGLVQGLTEFLPVSSSGHLVLAERALGLSLPGVGVFAILHFATLLAVLVVYWRRLWSLLRGVGSGDRASWRYVGLLALATLPAAAAGLLFREFFERSFDSLLLVSVDFAVTGAILWSTRYARARGTLPEPSAPGAGAIGLAQVLAILPGISRSGTTVAAALWLKVQPAKSAEFSFLMAIPAIAGAALLEAPSALHSASVGLSQLSASFVAALISGVVAIKLLVRMLESGTFHRFAPYCWALSAGGLLWVLVAR
ncbi:MAG: undecaprenyl-diphosphatase [Gemmatimonadales bacterium]|nr:MAG: undecaprenyl-diphosphatase [Gemmatimonadales bacterium]